MISIIVPVYNVEPYLDQCVRSIIEQTYTDLEIILVDDGSPDNCPAMCDAWAEKDRRIKVVHKQNGGLSDARNAGMDIASGEYIGFVDSDDWLEPDILESALKQLVQANADIIAFGAIWEYSEKHEIPHPLEDNIYCGSEQILRAYFSECMTLTIVVNKLYRKNILDEVRFLKGKLHEDEFFTYRVLAKANTVVVCKKIGYHYRQRENSIMGTQYHLRHLDVLEAMDEKLTFLEQEFPSLLPQQRRAQMMTCLSHYRSILMNKHVDPDSVGRNKIRRYIKRIGLHWSDVKGCRIKEAARHLGFYLAPGFIASLYNHFRDKQV